MHHILRNLKDASQTAANISIEHGVDMDVVIIPMGVIIRCYAIGNVGKYKGKRITCEKLFSFTEVEQSQNVGLLEMGMMRVLKEVTDARSLEA